MTAPTHDLTDVAALLRTVTALPPIPREVARQRIERALQGPAGRCRAELGVLALELAPAVATGSLDRVTAVVDLDTGVAHLELADAAPAARGTATSLAAPVHAATA